ncbi:hypothetical protein V6C07_11710, partial [Desulfovibrio sp. 1214_IL3152]
KTRAPQPAAHNALRGLFRPRTHRAIENLRAAPTKGRGGTKGAKRLTGQDCPRLVQTKPD